ncbi:MAG: FliM/FliN family flagellar motor switch protein [Sphingobium sp.]
MDDVQSYAFGRGEPQAPVMLSGLDRLGEKLGRRVRALVETIAGVRPQVTAEDAEVLDFGVWAAQVPSATSISIYRLQPLKGQTLVRLDADMISTLVDCFYGGIGNRPLPSRGEFTPTEDRLIIRIVDTLIAKLVECWVDVVDLEPALIARETGIGFGAVSQAAEQVVVQRFTVGITREQEWPIDIVFPLAALRTVEALVGSKVPTDEDQYDPIWRTRIARRMMDIRLPARSILARPNLTVAELMQLKEGDIIPVNIGRRLPLVVGNRIVAHGTIGEQDGRAAFQIEKLVQGPEQ